MQWLSPRQDLGTGFEPVMDGFADRRLNHLATPEKLVWAKGLEPSISWLATRRDSQLRYAHISGLSRTPMTGHLSSVARISILVLVRGLEPPEPEGNSF